MKDEHLTLIGHLDELRKSIIKSIVFIIACSFIFYNYIDSILFILIKPVGKLVFIAPQEAFVTNIKIAFFSGLFFSSPFVLYQIWQFISAGLKPGERKYVLIFGPLSFVFFVLGTIFGYFVIIPIGINFLLGCASEFVFPMITISRYISFVTTLTFAFGLIFELPIAILFLTKIGLVSPIFFISKRKEAIVFVFVIAALLTPPDVITQVLMALPLIILYELGIIFSKITYRKKELNG